MSNMLEEIRNACEEFKSNCITSVFDEFTKLVPLVINKLDVDVSADTYLHYDSSLSGTASAGFAITSDGFYAKSSFGRVVHTSFSWLANSDIHTSYIDDKVYANDNLVACFSWSNDNEELDCHSCIRLIKKIRSIAREYD